MASIEHEKRMLGLEKDRLDAEYDAGLINARQRIALLEQIEKKENALEMLAAAAKYQGASDKGDTAGMARAQTEIQSLADSFAKILAGFGTQGIKVDPIILALKKIDQQMDKTVSGIVTGQATIVGGFERMGVTLVQDMEKSLIMMGVKWAEHEVQKLFIHQLTNTGIIASDATAASQRQAIELTTSLKSITKSAASAAGKAYDAMADIPVVGPALGAAAAAATFAGVMAFEGMISAAGGADLGSTPVIAQLHPHEMVLPQNLADVVRGAAAGGGNSGGGHTFHVTNNYNGIRDSRGVAESAADGMMRALRRSNLLSA